MKQNKLDLAELFGKTIKQDERFFSKQLVNVHEFYLCGEIETPEEYIQWFDTIRHSGETDVIKIYINSPGGNVFTAIQFMRVLKESSAKIVMSVEGECASAATMIFLCGDSFEVSEHSMFMFHNYSSGVFGKGGEMFDQLKHERKWSERLLREIYEDFLTETEIVSILDNKDIWMSGDEIIDRLKAKKAVIESESESEEEQEQEEVGNPKEVEEVNEVKKPQLRKRTRKTDNID